jgi:predicted permease
MGVGRGFFETMGIPLLAGRSFNDRDGQSSQGVAVVNEQFARQFFPRQNPVGQTFRTGRQIMEIIGVAGDARYDRLTTGIPPTFYTYVHQGGRTSEGPMTFAVRTAADPVVVVPAVREAVRSIDGTLAMHDVRTQEDQIAATISQERLFATLSVAFAVLATALAGIGIFGILANDVARRTREIGIRIALGARREWLVRMIARETALVVAIGAATGVAAAIGLTRYVRSMLFGIEPIDPPTIAAAVLVMLSVALLAGWLPARRASRLEPMAALRHE